MNLPIVLSLIFFVTFIIYIFTGIYIFSISQHSIKNRVFFALCLSLSIWSFSFSIANSAPNYDTALFWRRISAIGWGTIYSIFLHFILILTERNKFLQKKSSYVIIYLPAIITVFIFSLPNTLIKIPYNLVYTSTGWINISVNNFSDYFFNIYYSSFTIASILLIVQWRITGEQKTKKVAQLLVISIATAFILGSITDIIFNSMPSGNVPQIAPVIILIPILAIFYSIKHYDLLRAVPENLTTIYGEILNEASRTKLYQYISLSYIFGIFITIISAYFIYQAPLNSVMKFSGGLFLFGFLIQIIRPMKIKEDAKDILIALIISLSIPFITLYSLEYACITVWVSPVIFLILSVLFNSSRILIILGTSIMITQLWVWIKAPIILVTVESTDHITRIFLFALFIAASGYVNHVFINRLRENENQVRLQSMISKISADFVNVDKSNLDEKIMELLQLSGKYHHVDRAYLLLFSPDSKIVNYTNEWFNDGVPSIKDLLGDIPLQSLSWWMNQTLVYGEVYIPDLMSMTSEAETEKKFLERHNIKSLLSVPIVNNGKILGFLGFDSVKTIKVWRKDHREILKILSNILSDALVKVSAEEEIKFMAFYDNLTRLPNRTLFKNRLVKEIYSSERKEKLIAIFFIDLDSFKSINDTMGHESGDEVLKQVASRLSGCIRKHDTVSRFGGDEFLIMFTNISKIKDIKKLAEKTMNSFKPPMVINNQEFFITASAGISIFPLDGDSADVLMKNADLAMYESKAHGKNKYTLCSPILKEDIMKKMKLTNSLYRANERSELELYYQPQIDIATKKIIGVEALIRWNHPEMGMIFPTDFIPLAEKTGLILPIGDWVLRSACMQSAYWQSLGIQPLRIAVNLSAEQFYNPNFVADIQKILAETGIDPTYLELEITESIAVNGFSNIVNMLNELKTLGVTISIDDFGTEYSSLNRLKTMPIDRIKIDIQFVRSISKSSKDDAIVKIIIQLAKILELKVIAEGVESKSQLDFLTDNDCDEIQGYYYYKPMPLAEIEKLLLDQYVSG